MKRRTSHLAVAARQEANQNGSDRIDAARSINWLESAEQAIESRCPQTRGCVDFITERLAGVLLERLPRPISQSMVELLPPAVGAHSWILRGPLRPAAKGSKVFQGVSDFNAMARAALSCTELDMSETQAQILAQDLTNAFLWAVARDLPESIKREISNHVPIELKSRMDLYTVTSDDSRVA